MRPGRNAPLRVSFSFMITGHPRCYRASRNWRPAAASTICPLGPVLTWTNERMLAHIEALLAIPGAELLFGGEPLTGHEIPDCYGALQATAVRVPIAEAAGEHFARVTTELFGPFQIVVTWQDDDLTAVLGMLERMSHHLTAAVVSGDVEFQNAVLGATVNGTTYCGKRARTTGAPPESLVRTRWRSARRGHRYPGSNCDHLEPSP